MMAIRSQVSPNSSEFVMLGNVRNELTWMNRIRRIILMPGLLEPRVLLWPLKRVLQKHCGQVEFFTDRIAFRRIDDSVQRLAAILAQDTHDRSIAIITHSFGDWVARQAIAQASHNHVAALVSVAPVMRTGLVPSGLYLLSGNLIPEIKVIVNTNQAAENLDCDDQVRRLVIWAKADACVRSVPLSHVPNLQVQRVAATHLSVVLQPGVLKRIEEYLLSVDHELEHSSLHC